MATRCGLSMLKDKIKAASLEKIQVLALLSQRCITHALCALYNLQIFIK